VVVPVSVVRIEDMEVSVETGGEVVVDSTVVVELSIGENLTAPAVVRIGIILAMIRKQTRNNTTRPCAACLTLSLSPTPVYIPVLTTNRS
jgi:hypothetical protein